MSPKIIGNRKEERKSRIDLGLAERLNRKAEEGTGEEARIEEPERIETEETNKGLEYNVQGKPALELKPLERTFVHLPTQEEYWETMRVYECGGWKWYGGDLPTSLNLWKRHKEETCVDTEEGLTYGDMESYQKTGWDVISSQEFYKIESITQEQIQEINEWFENQPESK